MSDIYLVSTFPDFIVRICIMTAISLPPCKARNCSLGSAATLTSEIPDKRALNNMH